MQAASYNSLAALLAYPAQDCRERLRECLSAIPGSAAAQLQVKQFASQIEGLSLQELQELFTRTFDLNPLCSLEIGWHLFGENYERGALLVKMRRELRRLGLPESTELPDHLTNALPLLARMQAEAAADFAAACVLPALEKMLAAMRGRNNPYENVLQAVRDLLHGDFPEIPLGTAPEPALKILT